MIKIEVKVCDVIMGSGKTESAITLMNEDVNSRYIFITPYLDEVERIKNGCINREFKDPKNLGSGKLNSLHELLSKKCNIASTHALFRTYNNETIQLIRDGGYKLILDEVFDVVEQIDVHQHDIEMLVDEEILGVHPDGHVEWISKTYEGKFLGILKDVCDTGNVILYNHRLMLWTFPIEIFKVFKDVIVLTYLFDAQFQKYYFDMNGVSIKRIGTIHKGNEFRFCEAPNIPEYVKELKDKIHIVDDDKLNAIGEDNTALSVNWYKKANEVSGQPKLKQLRNNISNVYKNRYKSASDKNLWTTFKDYKDMLKGKGYTGGFLSYNVRATNAYRNCDHLAYCVNVFYNPFMKAYFESHGVEIKQDEYALGEMIQWIWRSAIRDGNEIWVYIPSRRMRTLLIDWLDNQSKVL